ncbi:MAG: cytochrome c biogenesis CcdA family protein [Candidatus Thorarchaeota archaeon]
MQGLIELGVTLIGALTSGLYIAISPCLFPLLPLFLMNSLQASDSRKRSLLVTSALVAGILVSVGFYALISFTISSIGMFLVSSFRDLQLILGIVILFFGVVMISDRLRNALRLSRLGMHGKPSKPSNLGQVFVTGLAYTLLAAPCAGPAIIGLVGIFGTLTNPFLLLLVFALVAVIIAIPYFAIALVAGEARTSLAMSISNRARTIEIVTGAILILLGLLMILQHPVFGLYLLF